MPALRRKRSAAAPSSASAGNASSDAEERARIAALREAEQDMRVECQICLEDINAKRSATVSACNHKFHQSCIVYWMETRPCRHKQWCPLCRSRIMIIRDQNGKRLEQAIPFGELGQPKIDHVIRVAKEDDEQQDRLKIIESFQKQNEKVKTAVLAQQEMATNDERSKEWKKDIKDELAKLNERERILHQLASEIDPFEWQMYEMERIYERERRIVIITGGRHIDITPYRMALENRRLAQQSAAARAIAAATARPEPSTATEHDEGSDTSSDGLRRSTRKRRATQP